MATHDDVSQDEFLSALGRKPTDKTLEWFGITRRQYQAWSKRPSIRVPIALARLIRYRQRFHLAELLGKDWEGFAVHGNALEFPGLNRALTMAELRSLWFSLQQLEFWKHRAERKAGELARREAEFDAMERRLEFYRRQTRLESGMGMMLARVAA